MDTAKQRVRLATARKKEEAKLAKGTEEGTSSALKTVTKVSKRKLDRKDDHSSKRATVTPGDVSPKRKSPLKPSHGVGKGVMTSSGLIIKGSYDLMTYKDYAIGELGSFIKPMDIGPCDLLGTEDLRASAIFDLTRVCSLS